MASVSGANPSPISSRRIASELKDWSRAPPDGFMLESCEPMNEWVVVMQGPEEGPCGTLYKGQIFRLRIRFPDNYPLSSPEVVFLPPSPIHPHIYTNGHICLDVLYDGQNGGWSPALTVNKLSLSLRSMLASNTDYTRPQGDQEYCSRVGGKSPKNTRWVFDDDKV